MPRERKVLILVDVQNDFCPRGSLAVAGGDEVVPLLNNMSRYARDHAWDILASRDWHPEETPHFDEWPVHCVRDTEGAEFHPNLDLTDATVISKGQGEENGYSAFEGRTEGLNLSLLDLITLGSLDPEGIEVYIGGLATDYCVKATVLDALKEGFKTYLLVDAIRAVDLQEDDGGQSIEEMVAAGVILTSTDEVLSL